MAYPSPIRVIGSLNQTSDVFEYFKGALLDDDPVAERNPERWPYYYGDRSHDTFTTSVGMPLPNLPFSRQVFYDWIDYWTDRPDYLQTEGSIGVINGFYTINGVKLYTFDSPVSGWPIRAVNDWGKIKSLELGLFGNVTNGGGLSNQTIVGSGTLRSRIPYMKYSDPNYLRYGLVRFDSYGVCHPEEGKLPPPTNPVSNVIARTFDWTFASGYPNLNQYEYMIKQDFWRTVTAKPISIPFSENIKPGELIVRTRVQSGGYFLPSDVITNDVHFIGSYDVYLYCSIENFDQLYVDIAIDYDEDVPITNITASGQVQAYLPGSSFPTNLSYSVMLPAYTSSGRQHLGSINPGQWSTIISSSSSPATVNGGRSVNLLVNFEPPY